MNKISAFLMIGLKAIMATSLALMAILIFSNVVLRYVFHSGITWSEEMSRYLFIWLIFLGAISAMKDNEHLGMDMVIKRLPKWMKKICFVISNVLILYVLWLVLDGSWQMTLLNQDSKGPVTGIPLSFVYGIGIVMSISIALILVVKLYRVLFTSIDIDELTRIPESEELMDPLLKELGGVPK